MTGVDPRGVYRQLEDPDRLRIEDSPEHDRALRTTEILANIRENPIFVRVLRKQRNAFARFGITPLWALFVLNVALGFFFIIVMPALPWAFRLPTGLVLALAPLAWIAVLGVVRMPLIAGEYTTEETLDELRLTPLSPREIVLGSLFGEIIARSFWPLALAVPVLLSLPPLRGPKFVWPMGYGLAAGYVPAVLLGAAAGASISLAAYAKSRGDALGQLWRSTLAGGAVYVAIFVPILIVAFALYPHTTFVGMLGFLLLSPVAIRTNLRNAIVDFTLRFRRDG